MNPERSEPICMQNLKNKVISHLQSFQSLKDLLIKNWLGVQRPKPGSASETQPQSRNEIKDVPPLYS